MIAITSGLKPGERVITTGATMIKSGDRVRVIP
jgi:multidrug efflux pump subunit AcrA (membrane-fusion protein)